MKLQTMRPSTRQAKALGLLAGIAVVATAVLLPGQRYDTSQQRMHAGTAWLASSQIGQATLVDGATGEVAAHLSVAPPGSPLRITQLGSTAYVLDKATGALTRIDGGSEERRSSAPRHRAAGKGLVVIPTPRTLYEVDTDGGMVTAADPRTLTPRGKPRPLTARITPNGPAVDGRDQLWAVNSRTGELAWLKNRGRQTRPAAAHPGTPYLTVTRHQPALVDPARGTADLLNPDTGTATSSLRPAIHPGDTIALAGSPDQSRLLLAVGTRGTFSVCDFDTRSCTKPMAIGSPGSEFGEPVEVANHAIIPNHTTGQATIINLATMRVVAQRQLFDHPIRYELLARDGIIFFNDPSSNQAGVLDLSGNIRTITKYATPASGDDATPAPDPRTQTGETHHDANLGTDSTTQIGEKGRAGPGIPGRTTEPSTGPDLGGAPPTDQRLSIVVKPHDHGLVDDEFELTLVTPTRVRIADAHWWFGDETETTGTTARHRWHRPGTYHVRAAATLATDTEPAIAETTVTVDAPDAPPRITQLIIQRPSPVVGENVLFSAEVTGTPQTWAWSIVPSGQPAIATTADTPEFRHVFTTPGTYIVDLTVTSRTHTAHASRQLTVARGAVIAWGDNRVGQVSVPPQATSGVVAIEAGTWHSLALKADGSVIGWGDNEFGQISIPSQAASGVVAIAAGSRHSLALKADGSVIGWGDDNFYQISIPPQTASNVIAISTSSTFNMALKSDGSVIAWGLYGDPETLSPLIPLQATSDVIAVATGFGYHLALKADESVISWGGRFHQRLVPPEAAASGVVAISQGALHMLALKADGSVFAWGDNQFGESSVPPQAASNVSAISAGAYHSLALV